MFFFKKILLFRYTCTFIDQHIHDKFYMWNVSVSDHCCQHCDGVVYKADSVIETVFHQDKCETVETSICRILPGALSPFFSNNEGRFPQFASLLLVFLPKRPKNILKILNKIYLQHFCPIISL